MTDAMDPVRILASLSDPSRCRPSGWVWSMERVGELGVLCMFNGFQRASRVDGMAAVTSCESAEAAQMVR